MMDQLQQHSAGVMSIDIRFQLVRRMPEYKYYQFLQSIVGVLKGVAETELKARSDQFYAALHEATLDKEE